MDTRVFCVYNRAREVFVSSKVTVADTANEPLRMLSVLVGSMAQDAEAGLWLKPLYCVPSVPRLFPFDLVYLDKDHRVLESVEVLHGVRFPNYSPEVASALILPLRSMGSTRTQQGDRLIVCPQEDIESRLAEVEEPVLAAPGHILGESKNGSDREMTARNECSSPAVPAENPPGEPAVQVGPGSSLTAPETTVPAAARNGDHKSDTNPSTPEPITRRDREAANRAAYRPRWEELIEASIARSAGIEEKIRTSEPVEQTNKVATDSEPPKPPAEITEQTPGIAPAPAISEVEPEPPKIAQTPFRHDDPGDIFANWVASPFAPAWLEPTLESSEKQQSDPAATILEPIAAENETVAAQPTAAQPAVADSDNVSLPSSDSLPEARDFSLDQAAASTVVPAGSQATAFTIAQYGTWRVSAATTAGAVQTTEVTQTRSPKSAPTNGSEADDRPAAKELKPEGAGAERVPSPAASPSFAASATSKSARDKRLQDTAPLVDPEPISKTAPIANTDRIIAGVPVQNAVPEVRGPSSAAKASPAEKPIVPKLADLRSEKMESIKIAAEEAAKRETAVPPETKNGSRAKQPEANGATNKAADELTVTVPLPRFLKPEQKGKLKISIQKIAANTRSDAEAGSLRSRFQRWLKPVAPPSDRRRAHRRYVPGMVAYYFSGGAPKPHEIADISMSGFYLMTEDRWMPETMIQMTLQKPCARGERKQIIVILAKIVRKGSDGVGAEFVMPETLDQYGHAVPPERTTDRFSLARFL